MKDVTKLGNIADIYDGPHATPKKIENGKYFLSISSLDNGSLDLSKSAFISDKDFIKWTKRVQPQKGDLLFSYETRLGEAALMPDNLQACLGRRMGLLRPKKDKVIPQYLLFAYLSPEFQKVIRKNTIKGATVDRIALNELGNFPIYIPDLKTQQSIATVLSALDKKIALNKQINTRLEEMAKTLYDYWFVQFDFPDANGKPYKSSGGDMVFDETLKREIPKGWEVVTLKDFLTIKNGKDHKPLSDGKYTVYGSGGAIRCVDDYLFEGESVLIPRKGTLNNVMYIDEAFWTVDTMFYTEMKQDFFAKYVFYSIKDIDFTKFNLGTGVPSMTSSILYSLKIIKPSNCSLKHFEDVLKPIFLKIANNEKQNHHLTQLRDFLLPMLMNGQVSVAE